MSDSRSPVFAVLKSPSLVDFPGHLAVVLFTTGCNFRCGFCQNAPLLGAPRQGLGWDDLARHCEKARQDWVDAAVVTGGEPTQSPELPELLVRLRRWQFKIKLDTNGSRPDMLRQVLPLVDYVAMDIKCSLARYPEMVGFSPTARLAESVAQLLAGTVDHEFRTTVVETIHTNQEMLAIAELVRGARRYVLQPFLPRPDLPDPVYRTMPRTPGDRLHELRDVVAGCAAEVLVRGD